MWLFAQVLQVNRAPGYRGVKESWEMSFLTLLSLPPEYSLLQPNQKCHYVNVRCLDSFIWDQQICSYNTEVGFYVPHVELGQALAEHSITLQWLSYVWFALQQGFILHKSRPSGFKTGRKRWAKLPTMAWSKRLEMERAESLGEGHS